MKVRLTHVLFAIGAYEVGAYLFNSYQVGKPSPVGQAPFLLPFDFIAQITGGYLTSTNPVGASIPGTGAGGGFAVPTAPVAPYVPPANAPTYGLPMIPFNG